MLRDNDVVVILVLNKSIEQRQQVGVAFGYAPQRNRRCLLSTTHAGWKYSSKKTEEKNF